MDVYSIDQTDSVLLLSDPWEMEDFVAGIVNGSTE